MFRRVSRAIHKSSSDNTSSERLVPKGSSQLSAGFRLNGGLEGEGTLLVLGAIQGTVRLKGRVGIGAEGRVEGTVRAPEVRVDGSVDGEIDAGQRLVVTSSGVVSGDVACGRLIVEEGGRLRGPCRMKDLQPERAKAGTAPVGAMPKPAKA